MASAISRMYGASLIGPGAATTSGSRIVASIQSLGQIFCYAASSGQPNTRLSPGRTSQMTRKSAKTPDGAAALNAPRLRPQVVGNVGLYYAAYQLSQRGWNVMPTSRNARGVDILAYDMRAQNYLGIQVKALSKRNPVPLGRSIDRDRFMGDWWIIVIKSRQILNASS